MKIVADENMPGVEEWFSSYGQITRLPGREIRAVDVADAEVMLVRSVTNVNEELLHDSSVRFVGSATIGTDHVDCDYLASRNIHFANAPGCNANAVVEYVLSCLAALQPDWLNKQIAVIGCGNVGGSLLRMMQKLGVKVLGCDPYLDQTPDFMVRLEEALASDVVCVHTPLTVAGENSTFHLLNRKTLAQIPDGALLINAGRGSVIDNQALLGCLQQQHFRCALDVWENEPHINRELLDVVDIATPHIAGYSLDGKVKGTQKVYEAFLQWLGQKQTGKLPDLTCINQSREITVTSVNDAILQTYDVKRDDRLLRKSPEDFDLLRKTYLHRLEFSHYLARCSESESIRKILHIIGFAD